MAAPTISVRVTPVGAKMKDGYQTLISFASNPSIQFWEKTTSIPGMDGGEPTDGTTMHNLVVRTKGARHLVTYMPIKVKAEYSPAVYSQIKALINTPDSVTVKIPTGNTVCFWGFLQKAEFGDYEDGKPPEVDLTIVPTNEDPTTLAEQPPVFT